MTLNLHCILAGFIAEIHGSGSTHNSGWLIPTQQKVYFVERVVLDALQIFNCINSSNYVDVGTKLIVSLYFYCCTMPA